MAASIVCGGHRCFFRSLNGISGSKRSFLQTHRLCCCRPASYNPKPLRLKLREPYIPDRSSEKTPDWQKRLGMTGSCSVATGPLRGSNQRLCGRTMRQLERIIEEENQWHPPLEVKLKNLREMERQDTEKRLAKENLIAANMAKMPKMIADWRKEKLQTKTKMSEEKARRSKLLAEARESLGVAPHQLPVAHVVELLPRLLGLAAVFKEGNSLVPQEEDTGHRKR
ncbi:hypothetical protein F7725_004015 [Dissostichus mawsoni]|uniref:Large ribosomal subunit protein mL64 n=1 Tax=Dissostichus mawsoni TaxID=36200 RepID=A0A7J5YEF9_DISMA|nr:hypothetical protein F7725_004015 [Dissostichus mawsoni]